MITLDSNLRYRVVGVDFDISQSRPLKGASCGHTWKGLAWATCPRCGDTAVSVTNDRYHWLDRKTKLPLTYKDGSEAQFDSLDEAIDAFVQGRLSAERNEELQ